MNFGSDTIYFISINDEFWTFELFEMFTRVNVRIEAINRVWVLFLFSHHLSLFGHFLNVSDDLLLLLLQFLSLSVQFSHGSVERPLILPQHLLRGFPLSKQEVHLFGNTKGRRSKNSQAQYIMLQNSIQDIYDTSADMIRKLIN